MNSSSIGASAGSGSCGWNRAGSRTPSGAYTILRRMISLSNSVPIKSADDFMCVRIARQWSASSSAFTIGKTDCSRSAMSPVLPFWMSG